MLSSVTINSRAYLGDRPRTLRATICGSFRRDVATLKADYDGLVAAGCEVLSPLDVNFVDERGGFVYAAHELDQEPETIEAAHLSAVERTDLVWLHAPDGYVGTSAAMELGFAKAIGIPVFARSNPQDVGLRGDILLAPSPAAAVHAFQTSAPDAPARALPSLQSYYSRVAEIRGYQRESARDCLLLLTEEVGELARAVRKHAGLDRVAGFGSVEAADELADVQLYLLHLANILDVDLGEAVVNKERLNAERFGLRAAAA